MSIINTTAKWYRANRDESLLVASIAVFLASGLVIGSMVGRAFSGDSGFRESFRALVEFVPMVDLVNVVSVLIGVYFGLLLLLFFDFKKRIQSVLLIFGTAVSFVIIWANGVMFTAMGPIDWTIVAVSAFFIAYLLGGKKLRALSIEPDDIYRNRVFTTESDDPVEFPAASRYLWWILAGFVVLSLHEAYTQYPEFLFVQGDTLQSNLPLAAENYEANGSETAAARDILASFFFLGSFHIFLDYEASKKVVFVGPPRSGKTHLIIGLFSQAQNENLNPRNVSKHITDQRGFIIDNQEWAEETEAEIHDMSFHYTTPGLFSKNVVVDGLDYPGEYSYFIPAGLELAKEGMHLPDEPIDEEPPVEFGRGKIGSQIENRNLDSETAKRFKHLVKNAEYGFEAEFTNTISDISGKRDGDGGGSADQKYLYMVNSVLPRIRDADMIGFVFDTEQQLRWDREDQDAKYADLGYYQRIIDLSGAGASLAIATKADVLCEEFFEREYLEPTDDYNHFREFVNDRLLGGPFGGELQALQMKPYPVYLENNDGEDGPKVPVRAFGVNQLLEKLGR